MSPNLFQACIEKKHRKNSEALYSDARLVAAGYILMFSYTILMLGKWNSVELRLYLSMIGILGIGMGLVSALLMSRV